MEQLSDDLLVEILSRVPGKTVVRCKSVSKRFLALISGHIKQYIYDRHILSQQMKQEEHENDWYLDFVPKQEPFIFFSSGFLHPKFDLNFDGQHLNSSEIVSCWNDLLLCKRDHQEYYVCNPVTDWWIKLPQCPHGYGHFGSTGFVCEPYYKVEERNKVTFNRGYRFRVVFIPWLDGRAAGPKHEFKVVIFSSETGQWSWKQVSGLNDASFDAHDCWPAVAYGGRLYFEGRDNIMMYDPFNNEGRQYQTIDYPEHSNEGCFDVGVCCGKIRICTLKNPEKISVWELEEDFRWRLLHCTFLPMPQGLYHYGMVLNYHGRVQVKAFHAHHGDVVFYHISGCIFQANLKTKQVQTVATSKDWVCRPLQLVSLDLPLWPTPPPSI